MVVVIDDGLAQKQHVGPDDAVDRLCLVLGQRFIDMGKVENHQVEIFVGPTAQINPVLHGNLSEHSGRTGACRPGFGFFGRQSKRINAFKTDATAGSPGVKNEIPGISVDLRFDQQMLGFGNLEFDLFIAFWF